MQRRNRETGTHETFKRGNLVVNDALLASSKAAYKVINPSRTISAKAIRIASIKLGPFEMKGVQASTCAGCEPLLGQTVLSKFDLATSKVQASSS